MVDDHLVPSNWGLLCAARNILMHHLAHICVFLLGICLEVKLLGHKPHERSALVDFMCIFKS